MCKKVLWLLKNLNIKLSHDPEISLLGMFPKGLKTQTNTYMYIHVHSSTIYKSQDVENGPKSHQ